MVNGTFTAVFEKDGDWWIGFVEELPGANSQGRTIEEARENLSEAIELVVGANRDIARKFEKEDAIKEEIVVSYDTDRRQGDLLTGRRK